MRKIVMLNRITLDGFFAGPNGEIKWFIPDPEVDKAVHGSGGGKIGTAISGRVTYQMFETYWPAKAKDPNASKEERTVADELTQMTKVVFSKSLKKTAWENSRLVDGDLIEEVRKLKRVNASDIIIFGSGTIVQQLTDRGLIDEYLIVVTPVILGVGMPLFRDVRRLNLKLFRTKDFQSGNVLLHYKL